jgi:hypothetical protein
VLGEHEVLYEGPSGCRLLKEAIQIVPLAKAWLFSDEVGQHSGAHSASRDLGSKWWDLSLTF